MSGSTGAIAPSAQQTIPLSEIPFDLQVPGNYFEVNANFSQAGLLGYPARVLIVGQMLGTGTAVADTPYQVYDPLVAQQLFGAGSIAGEMAADFIAANPWVSLSVIGVADAAGATKAAASIAFTGAATAAGTLMLYIGGQLVQTAVDSGDAAATVATNVAAAITAISDIDVTAAAATGTVTLTARHGGTLGNSIDVRLNYRPTDATPAGITAVITAMTGGATDPDITNALDAISEMWFTDIVTCFNDAPNVALLEAALETRYAALGRLDAHAYRAIAGTPATVQTAQSGLNSRFASVLAVQNPLNPTWAWAAVLAGVASYYLAQDPSRQLRDLALPGMLAPAPADRYVLTERNILLGAGISTFQVGSDGTCRLERVVTEYLTSAQGVPDGAWHDIMVPKVMSRIRYDWAGYLSITYPRNKLADDGTLAAEYDDTVVTPKRLSGAWAGRCRVYGEAGWIENITSTVKQSVFVRDQSDPDRVNSRQQVQIIGNLMILAGSLEFLAAN